MKRVVMEKIPSLFRRILAKEHASFLLQNYSYCWASYTFRKFGWMVGNATAIAVKSVSSVCVLNYTIRGPIPNK